MQHSVTSIPLKAMNPSTQTGMFELRHEVFAVRLDQDVTTTNGQERDSFDELPHSDAWELSRFAVASNRASTAAAAFDPLTKDLLAEAARYALAHGIKAYVTVTTLALERRMKHSGLSMSRIGQPVQVGIVKAVAIRINAVTFPWLMWASPAHTKPFTPHQNFAADYASIAPI